MDKELGRAFSANSPEQPITLQALASGSGGVEALVYPAGIGALSGYHHLVGGALLAKGSIHLVSVVALALAPPVG